jgi:protein SCO1/2
LFAEWVGAETAGAAKIGCALAVVQTGGRLRACFFRRLYRRANGVAALKAPRVDGRLFPHNLRVGRETETGPIVFLSASFTAASNTTMQRLSLSPAASVPLAGWALLFGLLGLAGLTAGCQEADSSVVTDLRDGSYELVDQDSTTVRFPDAFLGDVLVVGYVYTHCPDVCPRITANMKEVRAALDDTTGVRFVTITFDPVRDTPSVLADYRSAYRVDGTSWAFLTGAPATIERLMEQMDVRRTFTTPAGDTLQTPAAGQTYYVNHTNQISLVDPQGRVRQHYGGSMTPPEILVEDINKLRRDS